MELNGVKGNKGKSWIIFLKLEDKFVLEEELDGDTKMIIVLHGDVNISGYSVKQLSCYRSGKNTLFEI